MNVSANQHQGAVDRADPASIERFRSHDGMTDRIRIIKHEAVPFCGSEVRFADRPPERLFLLG